MWYLLYYPQGNEERVLASCRQHISEEILENTFIFTYERMKKYGGQWHIEILPMFPDYIFLESVSMKALSESLEQYREIAQVLEDKEILWQVYPEEEQFLRALCGEKHHLCMSKGYIKNGVTHVTDGPLRGMEKRIRKIDRHKRIARIESPIQHMSDCLVAGLEIVTKD